MYALHLRQAYQQPGFTAGAVQQPGFPTGITAGAYSYTPPGGQQQPTIMQVYNDGFVDEQELLAFHQAGKPTMG